MPALDTRLRLPRLCRSAILLACLGAAALGCTCRKPAAAPPASASQPATTAPSQPTTSTAPAAPVRVEVQSADQEQDGWLRVEALYEGAKGGWASAHRPGPNRIVIETENVAQFSIDTSQLELNWSDRVWMRINNDTFELSHKRHPLIHLRETKTGAWEVVEVHDAP